MPASDDVTAMNDRYFAGRLAPAFLQELANLPADRDDVREIVDRLFRMMLRGGFGAADLSPSHGAFLGTMWQFGGLRAPSGGENVRTSGPSGIR